MHQLQSLAGVHFSDDVLRHIGMALYNTTTATVDYLEVVDAMNMSRYAQESKIVQHICNTLVKYNSLFTKGMPDSPPHPSHVSTQHCCLSSTLRHSCPARPPHSSPVRMPGSLSSWSPDCSRDHGHRQCRSSVSKGHGSLFEITFLPFNSGQLEILRSRAFH